MQLYGVSLNCNLGHKVFTNELIHLRLHVIEAALVSKKVAGDMPATIVEQSAAAVRKLQDSPCLLSGLTVEPYQDVSKSKQQLSCMCMMFRTSALVVSPCYYMILKIILKKLQGVPGGFSIAC